MRGRGEEVMGGRGDEVVWGRNTSLSSPLSFLPMSEKRENIYFKSSSFI